MRDLARPLASERGRTCAGTYRTSVAAPDLGRAAASASGLRLDAVGVEHVAHARADDPVQLAGLGAYPITSSPGSFAVESVKGVTDHAG